MATHTLVFTFLSYSFLPSYSLVHIFKPFLADEPQEYMPQAGHTSFEYSFLNRDPGLGHFETENDTKHLKNQLNTH